MGGQRPEQRHPELFLACKLMLCGVLGAMNRVKGPLTLVAHAHKHLLLCHYAITFQKMEKVLAINRQNKREETQMIAIKTNSTISMFKILAGTTSRQGKFHKYY